MQLQSLSSLVKTQSRSCTNQATQGTRSSRMKCNGNNSASSLCKSRFILFAISRDSEEHSTKKGLWSTLGGSGFHYPLSTFNRCFLDPAGSHLFKNPVGRAGVRVAESSHKDAVCGLSGISRAPCPVSFM